MEGRYSRLTFTREGKGEDRSLEGEGKEKAKKGEAGEEGRGKGGKEKGGDLLRGRLKTLAALISALVHVLMNM